MRGWLIFEAVKEHNGHEESRRTQWLAEIESGKWRIESGFLCFKHLIGSLLLFTFDPGYKTI
jgi:hypothetical protein